MSSLFKVISMGRVGTLAINRFINEHPQISLPLYKHISKVFIEDKNGLDNITFRKSNIVTQKGLLIHDAAFLHKKNRKALHNLLNVDTKKLIHVVRNPYDMALSWINYVNTSAISGVSGWQQIEPTVKGFYKTYKTHLQTQHLGWQCDTFYKGQKEIKIVDFTELLSDKIESTMTGIYDFLGVDANFLSPNLHKIQNSSTHEMLGRGISFELNGENIDVVFLPEDLFFHDDPYAQPWVTIHDTQNIYKLCPSVPALKGDIVVVPKDNAKFNALSVKTRQMLFQSLNSIVPEIMGEWARRAENDIQKIKDSLITQLSDQDVDLLESLFRHEWNTFFKYHPSFKTRWNM